MLRYSLRRIVQTVPLLLAVVVAVFLLILAAPGDPLQALMGEYPVPAEVRRQLTEKYQLDRPPHERLVAYVSTVLRGDLGYSVSHRQPVLDVILERLPNTILLASASLGVAAVVGVLLGLLAVGTRRKWVDTGITVGSLVGFAMPSFWFGQILIIVFALNLGWFPSQGMNNPRNITVGFAALLILASHLVLPALAAAFREFGRNARITRASMLGTIHDDYVTTLRAMGLSERRIQVRHCLRNAMLPVVTVVGYNFGLALAGMALIETVFSWPGIGRLAFDAITARDNTVVVGVVLITTVMIAAVNLLTDITYGVLDPRIRATR